MSAQVARRWPWLLAVAVALTAGSHAAAAGTLHHVEIWGDHCSLGMVVSVELDRYPSEVPYPGGGSYLDALGRCEINRLEFTTEYDPQQWAKELKQLRAIGPLSACDDLTECSQKVDTACKQKPREMGGPSRGCGAYIELGKCHGWCCDGTIGMHECIRVQK